MGLISNVFFRLMYRQGFTPWDSGVSPPELAGVIEGTRRLAAGRALDLGCGTGTTSVYMASNGWDVTGVDFVPRPVRVARAKAVAAGLPVAFLVGDVTRLRELPIEPGFDLLFDQGCFHSLPDRARPAYEREVSRMARSGATFLLYAFGRQPDAHRRRFFPKGITIEEVQALFGDFEMLEATPGTDPFGSHWYTLRRH
ncbi:MAG TPA: class I SAM-dependent methyltransferase [Candidatus Dormibacteraeota bacterium]|nr:class I SAM-dependent methyltransferase [Candidatus Dormibacteraeota bacterium]